ncbi:PLD nuclease N-terminal domain-containing protein [Pseudorhodobacter aquimaris]|uniref:PLD nuclease N-terminal domain-containing protein n=1 Tax=Pseudorhodobacter aquimaris TaxID=687412 RepID=UPI000A9D2D20|nr:PLD nuclease N-terminal domain-containing protein [Pseudorhodobacter aquimaris]
MTELNMFEFSGIGGLIVLVLDIWALMAIAGSNASMGRKVLWALLVIFAPILGFIIWFFFGPRARK